jgi:hypothetical protein
MENSYSIRDLKTNEIIRRGLTLQGVWATAAMLAKNVGGSSRYRVEPEKAKEPTREPLNDYPVAFWGE